MLKDSFRNVTISDDYYVIKFISFREILFVRQIFVYQPQLKPINLIKIVLFGKNDDSLNKETFSSKCFAIFIDLRYNLIIERQ